MATDGVSVIAPVHDNGATLVELARRCALALADGPHELILVDDRSGPATRAVLEGLRGKARIVELARRSGQGAAIVAGLVQARLPLSAVLDADLQDPPESLPALLARLGGLGPAGLVFAARPGPRRASSRLFKGAVRALYPALPHAVGLSFVLGPEGRARLLARAGGTRYLLAALASLELPMDAVEVQRAPAATTGYPGLRRTAHGARMLASALRTRAFGPLPGPLAAIARVY